MHAFTALAVATSEFHLANLLGLARPRCVVANALYRTVAP